MFAAQLHLAPGATDGVRNQCGGKLDVTFEVKSRTIISASVFLSKA